MPQWCSRAVALQHPCGEVNWELRSPTEFDTATRFVRPERQSLLISADLAQHAAWLQEYLELGFAELLIHQVGRNQRAFVEAATKVLRQIRT
jgi:coenzyme F420-dependent glucose-6-phosphate dehydrogenase